MRTALPIILGLFLTCIVSCARWAPMSKMHYKTATGAVGGDPESAELHFREAMDLLCANKVCEAEQTLHQSLICDDTFGPAHNALGKIYFDQKKFYLAAWEFEHANQLMPTRPEPLNNLGLVYEEVGQLEKSVDYYSQAMAIDESNPQYLGNYIRSRIRRGDDSADLHILLERLVVIDDRPAWREWARKQLVLKRVKSPESSELLPYEEGHDLAPGIHTEDTRAESLPEVLEEPPQLLPEPSLEKTPW